MSLLRPRHHLSTLTAFTFLVFFSASATTVLLSQLGSGSLQEGGEDKGKGSGLGAFPRVLTQKRHGGPGSSPPSCRSKCDKCSPCEPVHVPIQHGWRMPLEYYPEAWRCKCGNKLFMPWRKNQESTRGKYSEKKWLSLLLCYYVGNCSSHWLAMEVGAFMCLYYDFAIGQGALGM